MATWSDDRGPDTLWGETESDCIEMDLEAGTESRGAWSVSTDADSRCQAYRFVWPEAGDYNSLPTEGAYQYGSGCAAWIAAAPETCIPSSGADDGDGDTDGDDGSSDDGHDDDDGSADGDTGEDCPEIDRNNDCLPDTQLEEDAQIIGCSSVDPNPLHWSWLLALPALALRRRR